MAVVDDDEICSRLEMRALMISLLFSRKSAVQWMLNDSNAYEDNKVQPLNIQNNDFSFRMKYIFLFISRREWCVNTNISIGVDNDDDDDDEVGKSR